MDSILTATNGVGCNVFVYCNNNPIRYSDYFGKACEDAMGYGNPEVAKACMREYRRQQWESLSAKVNEIKGKINEDIENFDINNPYTTKVLRANYFSAYNGHLVLRLDWQRSGSFGIMVVKTSLKNDMDGRNEVRHEYGHTVQLDQLGVFKYLLFIGIPSAANWFGDDYYSRPQEVTADLFGKASNPHLPNSEKIGIIYFGWVKSLPPR